MVVERVHVAVVGYGYWGSKHVRVLSTMPDVAVTVVDTDSDRLEEAAATYPSVESTATDLDDVLDRVDAVLVATQPASHAPVALRALTAGKHVIVEKPLATSVLDAASLVGGRRGGQVLIVATRSSTTRRPPTPRDHPVRGARSGALRRLGPAEPGPLSRDVNVIWDLAPHDVSIASFLLDDLPVATSVWALRNIGHRRADVAYVRLDFPRHSRSSTSAG